MSATHPMPPATEPYQQSLRVPPPDQRPDPLPRLSGLGVTLLLAAAAGAAARARDASGGYLDRLARSAPPDRAETRDDILLVVSELVTNAVKYAPGPVAMTITHVGGRIRVAVRDTNRAVPRMGRAAPGAAVGGLGLRLVAALAAGTGVLVSAKGKVVYAEIAW